MTDPLTAANEAIRRASPALFRCLSPLGREAVYPPDIPFQAAQARGKRYNATIGQITDGRGRILALPAMEEALQGLSEEDRNAALLYSAIEGMAELRQLWHQWHRPQGSDAPPSSLPLVTLGLTHGLSLVADLFVQPGRPVVVPAPYWGNYRQTFVLRTGATLHTPAAYGDGRFQCRAMARALADLPADEPALVLVNWPSNPGGYSPPREERQVVCQSLFEAADKRPLVVVCDDAYSGLVYEDAVPRESVFWDLVGRHPNLLPVKVDGSTKEFVLFGGRVGFLTFPFPPDSPPARALESKVKCLLRATVGSPVAVSQVLLLRALGNPEIGRQVEATRNVLARRYRALKQALSQADPRLLRPLPFNSGAFALLELPPGLEAETVRHHLLEAEDTGVIAVAPRYLRIAFCSVDEGALGELVRRIQRGIEELVARRGEVEPWE